ADFGFTDPLDAASAAGANHLLSVKVTTLPGHGTLTVDGVLESAGDLTPIAASAGTIWTPRESPNYFRCVASSADGTKLAAGVDGGQIYVSTNSGAHWTPHGPNLH